MGRRGHLLDHRRVLLRHLVHLVDRGVDLIQAGRLFLGAGGDVGDHGVDLDHLRDDPSERLASLGDQSHALIDLRGRGGNQALDLFGRLRRTLGERAHLGSDDRETAARVAGARGLDPGVQRQQVRLEGDFVDDANDLADLLRRLVDAGHRRHRLAHDFAALVGVDLGGRDDVARVLGAFGGLLHCCGDLFERGGGFLEARGLLFGALRQIVGGRRNLAGARADRQGIVADRQHRLFQRPERGVEIDPQGLEGGNEFCFDAVLKVAFGQFAEPDPDLLDGAVAAGHVRHEVDDFVDPAVEVEDRIVGGLDPDFLSAFADALDIPLRCARRDSASARTPGIRATARRSRRRTCDDAGLGVSRADSPSC